MESLLKLYLSLNANPEIQIFNGLYYTFDEIKCVTYFFNSSLSVSFMVHYKHYSDAGRYTAYIIYLPSIAPPIPYTELVVNR